MFERHIISEIERYAVKDEPGISGGEAASQGDFLSMLARECRIQHISTCIETCGYAKWNTYEKLLPYIDYFYYDLKMIDEAKHKEATGTTNRLILDNFIKLTAAEANVIVRIPVIPGINNTGKNISDTIAFLLEHSPGCHVSLLPYHRLGTSKYEKLNMHYRLKELVPPSQEEITSRNLQPLFHGAFRTYFSKITHFFL